MGVVLFGLGVLVSHVCTGCHATQEQRVENASAVAQYDKALSACKEGGKDAGSYDVFEACERQVSRELCADSPAMQVYWPHCADVMVSP